MKEKTIKRAMPRKVRKKYPGKIDGETDFKITEDMAIKKPIEKTKNGSNLDLFDIKFS